MDSNRGKYKAGIDVKQLVRLPLLPGAIRDGVINSLDNTTILRNQLRGLLALDTYKRHKQENEEEHLQTVNKLRQAEWTLIESHVMILLNKDKLLQALPKPPIKEMDVPAALAREYNLLTFSPFIDFLRNEREGGPFEKCVDKPCEHFYSLREGTFKKSPKMAASPEAKRTTKYGALKASKPIAMQVLPEEVVFENFEVGNTYMVKVVLKNSGANSALLRFVRPQDPAFEICMSKKYTMLAPGLSVQLTVAFHCSDKDNRFDNFIVQPGGGSCITVPIKATQTPPLLRSIVHYNSPTYEDSSPKSTIYCGRCYVGTVNIVHVPIYNTGSPGRFFIMSESSWYFNTIKDTTLENVLIQKPFYIQPMYFSLNHKRKRKLRVVFSPQWEGSHLTQLFILCDNITMRSLDVIGESVMFDPDLFVIEGLEKDYNILIEGDNSATYFLYLGRVLSYSGTQKTFDIANKSVVETKFGWTVSRADIPGVNYMQPSNCTITPATGSLCPQVKMMFTVTFYSHNLPVGKYAAVFSIYLECIPKLAMLKRLRDLEKEDISELMVKICLGKIEVWVEIEPPNVCIWPNYLYFRNIPTVWNFTKIYITNYENISITIAWQIPYLKNLLLSPPVVDLAPYSSTYMYVMLQTELVGTFMATLSAFFIQSLCKYDVRVECETAVTLTSGMSEIKDFGILRKAEPKTGTVHATFQTNLEVDLDLRHFSMRYNKQTGKPYFTWLRTSKWVLQCPNSLIPNKPSEVIIKARTKKEQITIDLFEWRFCNIQAYTTILSDVQEQDITLNPIILDIHEPLFVGGQVSFPIKIVNHRQLLASFTWGCFFGEDLSNFKISVRPKQGPLPPVSETEITVTILPYAECILQNLYYTVSIKYIEKPMIGMIRGFVRESLVAFSWISDGKEIICKWPQEEDDPKHRQYPSAETSISEDSSDKDCEVCFTEGFTSSSSFKSISPDEIKEAEIMAFKDPSDNLLVPYDNWPYIGGKYFGADFTDEALRKEFETPWTEESVKDNLKSMKSKILDSFLENFAEKSMNFTVETFKVHTQILYISNLSPSPIQYRVKTNFFHAEKKLPHMDPFLLGEMVFHDEGLGYDDAPSLEKYKWCHRVRSRLGLAIRVKQKKGTILADEVQEVTVSVFAMAWGTYFDNVSVMVDSHPPFHVPIMVKCEHPPAFFTFAPDTISPLLRFPSIRPNRIKWKQVYLENTCPFVLKIVWTVYLDQTPNKNRCLLNKNQCLPLERDPDFGLALELHPKKDSDFCKLKLIPYAGVQENLTYTIEPTVLYIPPRSKAPLLITVNSQRISPEFLKCNETLSATAFGLVYIEDDSWNNEECFCCYRPDGYGTNRISLKLLTVVEDMNFKVINNSLRDAIFKVCYL
ncbi:unnamed protein product, partial [Nezara viridula]